MSNGSMNEIKKTINKKLFTDGVLSVIYKPLMMYLGGPGRLKTPVHCLNMREQV